ncbi:MAG: GNAT family N-acetyltransferase [Chlamydiae bacterium]|nr:GNAT family N-acetyltransferase [Chlamydiota bacterium]
MNKQQSQWITFIKKTTLKTGTFEAKDSQGQSIILEWTQTDIQSSDLAAFKKSICDLASQVLAASEVQFLRIHPEAVSQEMFLQPCTPLFEQGVQSVNWQKVEEQIKSTVKQFYLTDLSAFGDEVIKPLLNDIYFYVVLKNRVSNEILGFLMFAITPALEFGNIKIIHLALMPSEQDRGLEKLLMSSIFKIVQEVKRLFIYVRPTNEWDINMYNAWGFHQDLNPIQDPNHKVNMDCLIIMEYKTELSKSLQETAKALDVKK